MKKTIILIISLFVLTSCKYQDIEFKGINAVTFTKTETDNIVNLDVRLYNPNNYTITIKSADLDLLIKDVRVGTLKSIEKIKINKRGEFNAKCHFAIDKKAMFTLGFALLKTLTNKKVEINVKGNVSAKYLFVNKNFKINHKEIIDKWW